METMPGLPARDYVIHEYTRSLCPKCWEDRPRRSEEHPFIDAMLVERDGSIWMRKWCPEHGEQESLYEEDAELWHSRAGWSTPTLEVRPDRPPNGRIGLASYANGLPAGHGQHTCILLLNITENCNYACPTCYATALPPGAPADPRPTLDEIKRAVMTGIEREGGQLGVLMLSGGEPTIRKDIDEIMDWAQEQAITRIMLNTNGRRIARDPAFAQRLAQRRGRVEVYLQYDADDDAVNLELRGESLIDEKRKTLETLGELDIPFTLVMTAQKGVNDGHIGEVAERAANSPSCSGAAIQPVFGSGRNVPFDPMARLTPTGVQRRVEEQTEGRIPASAFIPLPCSHKDCCDIGYLIQDRKGKWRPLTELVGRETLKRWIGMASNTITFDNVSDTVKQMAKDGVMQAVMSEREAPSSLKAAADMFRLCSCVPGLADMLDLVAGKNPKPEVLERLARRTTRLTIKMFMDAHTFHEARLRQCCVHIGTFEEDPRRYSFCWRWLLADAHDFPDRASELPMVS